MGCPPPKEGQVRFFALEKMPKDPMTRLICSGCGNTLDPSVAHCPACDEPTNSAGLLFELELPAPLHEAGYILTTGLTPGDVFDATRPSFNLHSPEGIDFAHLFLCADRARLPRYGDSAANDAGGRGEQFCWKQWCITA